MSSVDPGEVQPLTNLSTNGVGIMLPAGAVIGGIMAINLANFGLGGIIDGLNNMIMASNFQAWMATQNAQIALEKTTGNDDQQSGSGTVTNLARNDAGGERR